MCFFLKVAITSDLLLLPYSGADTHNWRQPGTGRWGKWDTPTEENTQRVSDLRWLLGLSRAAEGTHLLCKCLAQAALKLYCCGPVHKVLMPTKHDLEPLFPRHSSAPHKLDGGLEFTPILAVLDQPLLFLRCNNMKRQVARERLGGPWISFLLICSPAIFASSSGVSCFRRAC